MRPLPFAGIRVIELASVLAGPSVGMFFAELGAQVLKVESPPEGDVTRTWKLKSESAETRTPAYFCSVNWGKQYCKLNLMKETDRQVVYEMIPQTDIVLSSYKPGDAQKLGMDWMTLSALNDRLILGEISGYGSDNPRVGYDAIVQAESGFTYMNGEPNGLPVKMPVALMDILAAHQLKEGLLTALYHRTRTGKGDYIQVSLIQSGVASLANQAGNYLMAGHVPERMGSAHPNIAPYGTLFLCADQRYIVLAVGSDKQFQNLLSVLGLTLLQQDRRFDTNAVRVVNRGVLETLLAEAIARFNRDELLVALNEYKVPAGAVNSMAEVFELREAQGLVLEKEGKRSVRTIAFHALNFGLESDLIPPGE
jgi:crotonobetainyl-CoA:carnitine CoA-transferase CaiB-like acyl-CoA transferase